MYVDTLTFEIVCLIGIVLGNHVGRFWGQRGMVGGDLLVEDFCVHGIVYKSSFDYKY